METKTNKNFSFKTLEHFISLPLLFKNAYFLYSVFTCNFTCNFKCEPRKPIKKAGSNRLPFKQRCRRIFNPRIFKALFGSFSAPPLFPKPDKNRAYGQRRRRKKTLNFQTAARTRQVLYVFLSLFALSGCNSAVLPLSRSGPPQLFVIQKDVSIPLSDFNDKSMRWNFTDEIMFSGVKEEKPPLDRKKDLKQLKQNYKIKITSNCLNQKNQKWERTVYFDFYKTRFAILDLLPEAVFLEKSREKNSVSCSFRFEVKAGPGPGFFYDIDSAPLAEQMKGGFDLRLTDGKTEARETFTIQPSSFNSFNLVLQENKEADAVKFLCEGEAPLLYNTGRLQRVINQPLNYLLTEENKTAGGKKACRILAYNSKSAAGLQGGLQGMTGFFVLSLPQRAKIKTGAKAPPQTSLPSALQPFIKEEGGSAVSFSKIKDAESFILNLRQEIFFKGMEEQERFDYKTPFNSHPNDLRSMSVSSNCILGEDRLPEFKKNLKAFPSGLLSAQMLPKAALSNHKESVPLICSFKFVIQDIEGQKEEYELSSYPVQRTSEHVLAYLRDRRSGLEFSDLADRGAIDHIDLVFKPHPLSSLYTDKMEFLCENNFSLTSGLSGHNQKSIAIPFHVLLPQSKSDFPKGVKICRILTYGASLGGDEKLTGLTGFFTLDFSSLLEKKPVETTALSVSVTAALSPSPDSQEIIPFSQAEHRKALRLQPGASIHLKGLSSFRQALKKSAVYPAGMDFLSPIHSYAKCRLNGKAIHRSRSFPLSLNRERLDLIQMLPEEVFLLNIGKDEELVCSFAITLYGDKTPQEFHLPPLRMEGVEKNFAVQLTEGKTAPVSGGMEIQRERMQDLTLKGLKSPSSIQEIKFLCEENKSWSFQRSGAAGPVFPFRYLLSKEALQFVIGVKACRIFVYDRNGLLKGLTVPFQVNFSALPGPAAQFLSRIKALSVTADILPPDGISSRPQKPRRRKGASNVFQTVTVFEIPNLFLSFPSGFSVKDYKDHKIYVETGCAGNLFENSSNSKTASYELPLLESFPLMAVTPKEVFQIYFPENLHDFLREIDGAELQLDRRLSKNSWKTKYRNKKRKYQAQVICSYSFYIKNQEKKILLTRFNNREIMWNPGSYGISLIDFPPLSKGDDVPDGYKPAKADGAPEGWPLFIKTARGAPKTIIDFSYSDSVQPWKEETLNFHQPNRMEFVCGGERGAPHHYQKNILFGSPVSQKHLSLFAGNGEFIRYMKKARFAKCRLMLYKNKNLRYFSQDIKFIYSAEGAFDTLNLNYSEEYNAEMNTCKEDFSYCRGSGCHAFCYDGYEECDKRHSRGACSEIYHEECMPDCRKKCYKKRGRCESDIPKNMRAFWRVNNFTKVFYWL